jgi:hypothetical protein
MYSTGGVFRSASGYPRVELNSATNLIAALSAPGVYAGFLPNGVGSVPSLVFVADNTTKAFIQRAAGTGTTFGTFDSEPFNLQASSHITAQSNGNVTLKPSANLNLDPTVNLQINGFNGSSGTYYVATTPGGTPTQPISFTKGLKT